MHRRFRRLSSLALCAVYAAANAALANAAESNFWADRRRASMARPEGFQTTGLPAAGTAAGDVVRQLPSLDRVSRAPVLSPSVAEGLPGGFVRGHAALLNALPQPFGTVRRILLPDGASARRTVVHIQDVHRNAEAQRNIGLTVQSLIDAHAAGLVALEGAFGPVDLSRYRAFPDHEAVRKVADWLLRENRISGPVHAAFTSARDIPPLLGVDDPAHYDANVAAYAASAPKAEACRRTLAALRSGVERRKAAVFNPALLAFDRQVQAYREGKAALGDYVRALTAPLHPGGDGRLFPSIGGDVSLFMQALRLESSLDFKQVEAERARLVESLVRRLPKERIDFLVRQSAEYRTGRLRYGDFYRSLKTLCAENGVPLSRFPALDAYVKYVLLADRISAEKLLEELGALEKADYARLAGSAEEKTLVAESTRLHLAGKLVDFSLTPEEWKEYEAGKIPKDEGVPLSSFEDFYREAQSRDEAMTRRLLEAMDARKAETAVLVTGGYHSPGMDERLRRAGVAVVSFTPRIEKVDDARGSTYLSVFTQEKTPLEKLFQGQKLFLSPKQFTEGTDGLASSATALFRAFVLGDRDEAGRTFSRLISEEGYSLQATEIGADGTIAGKSASKTRLVELLLRMRKDGNSYEPEELIEEPLRERASEGPKRRLLAAAAAAGAAVVLYLCPAHAQETGLQPVVDAAGSSEQGRRELGRQWGNFAVQYAAETDLWTPPVLGLGEGGVAPTVGVIHGRFRLDRMGGSGASDVELPFWTLDFRAGVPGVEFRLVGGALSSMYHVGMSARGNLAVPYIVWDLGFRAGGGYLNGKKRGSDVVAAGNFFMGQGGISLVGDRHWPVIPSLSAVVTAKIADFDYFSDFGNGPADYNDLRPIKALQPAAKAGVDIPSAPLLPRPLGIFAGGSLTPSGWSVGAGISLRGEMRSAKSRVMAVDEDLDALDQEFSRVGRLTSGQRRELDELLASVAKDLSPDYCAGHLVPHAEMLFETERGRDILRTYAAGGSQTLIERLAPRIDGGLKRLEEAFSRTGRLTDGQRRDLDELLAFIAKGLSPAYMTSTSSRTPRCSSRRRGAGTS